MEERHLPNESYAVLLEALVAAVVAGSGKNPELDYEYLGNPVTKMLVQGTVSPIEAIIKAAQHQWSFARRLTRSPLRPFSY